MAYALLWLLATLAAAGTAGAAGDPQPPQVSEDAPQQSATPADEVVVVTASRREEQLRNAPATMTVVTDTAVNNVPVQTVADILRRIPGVNVSQASARDVNVTPRAATGTLSDSLLVLLDGRSIYQD
jgi:outer membrane receptor for ferrienterochelin and colicins